MQPSKNAVSAVISPGTNSEVPRVDKGVLPMELDQDPASKSVEPVHDHRTLAADSSRHHDALSSPGSTAQSALTPAVHDVSANTSPDDEGPRFLGRSEEASGDKPPLEGAAEVKGDGVSRTVPSAVRPTLDGSLPAAISGVDAQLLQESAAARISEFTEPSKVSSLAQNASQVGAQAFEKNLLTPTLGDRVVQNKDPGPATEETTPADTTKLPSATAAHTPLQEKQSQEEMDVNLGTAKPRVSDLPHAGPDEPSETSQAAPSGHAVQESQVAAKPVPASSSSAIDTAAAHGTSLTQKPAEPKSAEVSTTVVEAQQPVSESSNGTKPAQNEHPPVSQSPPSSKFKALANKARDKRRRSVPTVIFGKPPRKSKAKDDSSVVVGRSRPGQIPTDDYFTPLFIEGFTRQSTWMKPIEKLLNQAHKTISTSDQYVSILDHQACKILRRVYHLQQHDKWSLRQPVRCPEPTRPASHMDVLLQEMKWMRTDFREEGKWKRAVARNLAYACAEWVYSSPEERLALQVNAVIPPRPEAAGQDAKTADPSDTVEEPLPDLVHSDSPMEVDEEPLEMMTESAAPAAIFALQDDEVVFGLQPSKAADALLENLPMHGSPLRVPKFDISGTEYDPDATWKRPAVPLSKFVEGEMVLASTGPPRKRRRYDYLAEDEEEDDAKVVFESDTDHSAELRPENTSVALFRPEMKAIRDRLHAGHQFRPPTEHPMPPQSFFECRTPSQWTWAEDEQLKSLVRECSYNWSLVSAMASPKTAFASAAERRTPWECFERWVSLGSLEGVPNDMARTPYFKAYQSRIEAAQRNVAQQNQPAQQQVGPNGTVTPVPRRRGTTSIRVERRRNQKHLALIDAMRKLAKKRETAAQKAQHAANLAAMRKANEVPRQQIQNKTPRDYSLMRWERDQALAEKMAAYALRHADATARRLVRFPAVNDLPSCKPESAN